MSKYKILFQLSGSIAGFKACELISRWQKAGHDIEVVVSASTLKFVGVATLEGLIGKPIFKSLWQDGQMMAHIDLARWCDFAILCPASASAVNQLANGTRDDLIGGLFLAFEKTKPYFIAPAMNSKMYEHPSVQNSIERLQTWGYQILNPEDGRMACGETGTGRLMEPAQIDRQVIEFMNKFTAGHQEACSAADQKEPRSVRKDMHGGSILITSGGTKEPIDSVRAVTNTSSGQTGATLADHFSTQGWQVTLLRAKNSARPQSPSIKIHDFETFADLDKVLSQELQQNHFDSVLHLAAVSDFSVDKVMVGKKLIKKDQNKLSSAEAPVVHFKKNIKLVNHIREWSLNPNVFLVAFKLTNTTSKIDQAHAIENLFRQSRADVVVHNDQQSISETEHIFNFYSRTSGTATQLNSKQQLAHHLIQHLRTVRERPAPNQLFEVEL